jgi:hypothetical protein
MWAILVASALAVAAPVPRTTPVNSCSPVDRIIYQRHGHDFPTLFRSFGGLWVSQDAYVTKVMAATGLTPPCAACYGEAYTCGFAHCKWSCARAGGRCDRCLQREGCIGAVFRCTGF